MTTLNTTNSSTFWKILKILFALLLSGFVLSRTDLQQLPGLFESISIPSFLLSAILFLSLTLLKTFQYQVLLRGKITYPQILNVVVLQNAVSNYLASSAGIASYLTLLRVEHNVKISRSVIMFIMTKIGDLIVLWLALLVSALWVWPQLDLIRNIVIGLFLTIGAAIAVFFLTLLYRRRFVLVISSVMDRLSLSHIPAVQKGLDILEGLSEIERGVVFGRLAVVCGLSLVYFVVSASWYYSVFIVFNFPVDIPALVFVNVLIQLISYFPIQVFGGLGVSEMSSLFLWSLFGVSQSALAPVLVGSRILFYLLNLLPLIYLPVYAMLYGKAQSLRDQ